MSLPAALQARLAKRGLLQAAKNDQEEVFAESYDDPHEPPLKSQATGKSDVGLKVDEPVNCPNLSNPFHECTVYCKQRYGLKVFQPNPIMERRRIRMLKIYPLPQNWVEVADINTSRYYYWNTETDQVCWVSPAYPKAEITMPTKRKATETRTPSIFEKDLDRSVSDEEDDEDEDEDDYDDDEDEEDDDEEEETDKKEEYLTSYENTSYTKSGASGSSGGHNKNKHFKRGGREAAADHLDPMDPASYSDIPRGKWSEGLETKGRNAADTTASGPLFQQRPYPSPGQVLRMNPDTQKKSK